MNGFVYDIPTKVYFGSGQLQHLGMELSRLGKRILLVYGGGSIKKNGLYDSVTWELKRMGLMFFELGGIAPNPRVESVREGAALCKKEKLDVILAVGGGSVIDAAKYIAAAACVDLDPWKFMSEQAPLKEALPVVTVLTIAATGSEMDSGGVITNLSTNEKLCRFAPPLQPQVSFLDPKNTYSVSRYQTACGTADIMSHIIEVYFNMTPDLQMLDGIMESLMKTVICYAPVVLADPENYEARANLMWAGSWAINGFIKGGKQQAWSCHPMEHELSALYDITHGLGLAILTPRWMEYTLDETTASKFVQFGVNVFSIHPGLPPMEIAMESIRRISEFFFHTLGLNRTLGEIGIDDSQVTLMAQKACRGDRILGFKTLYPQDVEKIYQMCI